MHVTLAEYLVVVAVAGLGAMIQGAVGFGANLIAVPVVAVVVPEALPGVLVLWAVPLVVAMALQERHGVDWSGVGWMTLGRLPGTALGVWIVSVVAVDTLSVLCGGAVLVAVVVSLLSADVPLRPVTKAAAGFASGTMGTATSIGGPPMALLYQHQDGRTLRSTLAVAFTVGTGISLLTLTAAGAIEGWHVLLALALLPGLVTGLLLSRVLAGAVDRGRLRPVVLGMAAAAAVAAMIHGLA